MVLKKVLHLIKNIKQVKFTVERKKIVVFDGLSIEDLKYVIKDYHYFVLEDRPHRISEIYVTPLLILNFFSHFYLFFKDYSLKNIYNIALIRCINPKIVITSIDNSISFYLSAKILYKEIFFLAVQNANRSGFRELGYGLKKKVIFPKNFKTLFFIPNLICFGQDDVEGAKKENLNVGRFFKFGSMRMSNFFCHLKENNIELKKDLFDICLISEPMINNNNDWKNNSIEESSIKLVKFTIDFCMQNNLAFVFATKYLFKKQAEAELNFYRPHLSEKQLEYLILNTNKKSSIYSSYEALMQSNTAVGWQSSLLFDKIGLNEKILSCNFSNFEPWDFPINGICSLKNKDYQSFSKRLKFVLKLSNHDYLNKLEKSPNFVMNFDIKESVIEKTRKILKKNI